MALTHNPSQLNGIIEWTNEINDIDNQYGFIRSQTGMFNTTSTSQKSIIFDRERNTINMMRNSNDQSKDYTVGKDRDISQYAMALEFFKHKDYIDVEDIQGQRMIGSPDVAETLSNVRAIKLEDLKMAHDQRDEFLRFTAMTGDLWQGAANGSTNVYELFGFNKADFTVDLESDSASTDLDQKIATVKRLVAEGIKSGTAVNGIDFYLDPALYDEIIAHPKFREVYNQYVNSGSQRLRDDLSEYYSWGLVDMFEHRGVRFMSYNPTFLDSDGSSVQVLGAGQGIALPRGSRDFLRGYFGPATKLSLANQGGQEMYAFEYTDQSDENHTIELQKRVLYFATKPEAIIHLN